MFEIIERYTRALLYRSETASTVAEAVSEAVKADANLTRANLTDARNVPLSLVSYVDPVEPYVRKPGRSREKRMLAYRARHPDVPVVPGLDRKVLDSVQDGAHLEMSSWHTCESTHCRGGWAIHHAGEAGYALERKLGNPLHAARAIYLASTGRTPFFFDTNEGALEDIRRCAAELGGGSGYALPS